MTSSERFAPAATGRRVALAAVLAAGAVAVAAPRPAAADEGGPRGPGFSIGSEPAWFLTGGTTAGGTVAGERGAFVGGELSLVRVIERSFVGLYGDAYYDFGANGAYLTFGPELGIIRRSRAFPVALGIDGGGALRLGADADGGDPALGVTGRVFLAFVGTVGLFGRYAYFPSGGDGDMAGSGGEGDHVVQVGITFKFPLARPFGAAAR